MAYITLDEYKKYADISSTDVTDDAVLTALIAAASNLIDHMTGRHFSAVTQTRYFAPNGTDTIFLDDDLLTVTSVTNGDADVLTASEYFLLPTNSSPKYAVQLRGSSGLSWQSDSAGDGEQAITIVGTWGYSATPPDDIMLATYIIAKSEASRRSGQGVEGVSTVTGAGVVIEPTSVPRTAATIISNYKRGVLWP